MLTYNHEKFIKQAILSIQNQTFTDWELIIIDDGSTDATRQYAVGASSNDSRITLISGEHCGTSHLADLYNKALSKSKGEWIAILEGDDFWEAEHLELHSKKWTDPDLVLCYSDTIRTDRDGTPFGKPFPPRRGASNAIQTNTPVGVAFRYMTNPAHGILGWPCSTTVRKSSLEEIGGFKQWTGVPTVDWPTYLMLAFKGRFAYIKSVTSFWRRWDGAVSNNYSGHVIKRQSISIAALLNDRGISQDFYRKWNGLRIKAVAHYIRYKYSRNRRRKYLKFVVKYMCIVDIKSFLELVSAFLTMATFGRGPRELLFMIKRLINLID